MDRFKVFTFNPEGFDKAEELNEHLHGKDLKAVYMIDPGIKVEKGYSVDDEGRARDCFVKRKDGISKGYTKTELTEGTMVSALRQKLHRN